MGAYIVLESGVEEPGGESVMAVHVDSGITCCVAHFRNGMSEGQCIQCKTCGEYVRPENMGEECPGREPVLTKQQVIEKDKQLQMALSI